jgi:uncharacterized protein
LKREDAAVDRMIRMSLLLDVYGALLTDKQREFMRLHYEQDQSFGEIAGQFTVSRQAVHDSVKHAEQTLEELEDKLRLVEQAGRGGQRRDVAARLLDLKQRIQQQGIIYNADWIVRDLTEIIEGLIGREEPSENDEEPPSAGTEELIGNNV